MGWASWQILTPDADHGPIGCGARSIECPGQSDEAQPLAS